MTPGFQKMAVVALKNYFITQKLQEVLQIGLSTQNPNFSGIAFLVKI
jgi:hypothetical protein